MLDMRTAIGTVAVVVRSSDDDTTSDKKSVVSSSLLHCGDKNPCRQQNFEIYTFVANLLHKLKGSVLLSSSLS